MAVRSPIEVGTYAGKVRNHRVAAACTSALVAASLLSAAPASANQDAQPDVVGLVVTRAPGTSAAEAQRMVHGLAGEVDSRTAVAPGVTALGMGNLSLPEAEHLATRLVGQEGIAEVGIDTRARPALDDPEYPAQWSLTEPVSGIAVDPAWQVSKGAGTVIAVIDTGITAHEDLDSERVLPGYDFVTDPLIANDGDGRDPDASDPGDWVDAADLADHPGTFSGCPVQDSRWHGTHVAGLAAAMQGNAKGIAGVASQARILPVRALGKCGGTMSDIAAAITWASGGEVPGVPVNPQPADVINLSLSSSVTCQSFVQAAIDDAIARGSVVVASAGNTGQVYTRTSPAGCYDVLAVGAVDRQGVRTAYSNFGTEGRDLPVFAPGGAKDDGLVSTVNPGSRQPVGGSGYARYPGTSMAAPLASGSVALLAAARPDLSPAALVQQIRATVRPFGAGSNCAATCGLGLLDAGKALTVPTRLPGAVSDLQVQSGDGSLALQWVAPTDSGTGPMVGYTVEIRQAGGQWSSVDGVWSSTLASKVVTGLTNNIPYQARVAARTAFGTGPWQESAQVTPLGLPGQVRIRSVRYPSKTSAAVSLTLPVDALLGVQYRLLTASSPDPAWIDQPVTGLLRIPLRKGIRHTLQVRGFNRAGASAAVSRAVATPVPPTAVRGLRGSYRGKVVAVRWQEPRRTGLRVAYRVRIGGTSWQRTKATGLRVRGVRGKAVRVQVQSHNEAGKGPVRTLTKRK